MVKRVLNGRFPTNSLNPIELYVTLLNWLFRKLLLNTKEVWTKFQVICLKSYCLFLYFKPISNKSDSRLNAICLF